MNKKVRADLDELCRRMTEEEIDLSEVIEYLEELMNEVSFTKNTTAKSPLESPSLSKSENIENKKLQKSSTEIKHLKSMDDCKKTNPGGKYRSRPTINN